MEKVLYVEYSFESLWNAENSPRNFLFREKKKHRKL